MSSLASSRQEPFFGFVRFLLGWIGTRKLLRDSQPVQDHRIDEIIAILCAKLVIRSTIQVYQTSQLTTAATMGAFRPAVLLPMHWLKWTDEELYAVLAHELAHISHRDFAIQMLSQVSVVLHFYHPFIHWLSNRLRLEQELAADSRAAQVAGGNMQYVSLVSKTCFGSRQSKCGLAGPCVPSDPTNFLRRLEMLRNAKTSPATRPAFGRWLSLLMITFALWSLSA